MSQGQPGLIERPAGRVLNGEASCAFFAPRPFGPEFDQPDPSTVVIRDGKLAGQLFRLETEIAGHEAHVRLQRDSWVGHCDFELETEVATILLWDVFVRPDLQHNGLAALMVRLGLRRLFRQFESASVGIRMIQLLDPGHEFPQVKNVGMGVIAHQLGFAFVCDLPRVLRSSNIERVELIFKDGDTPPAYRILLRGYPLMLVAVLTALDTGLPLPGGHPIYYEPVTPLTVERWADDPSVIFGNGNYVLRRSGMIHLVNRIANTPEEAAWLIRRIRPLP